MPRQSLKLLFVLVQACWMLVVLPGHTRGMIVMPGPACSLERADGIGSGSNADAADNEPTCCAAKENPYKPGDTPSPERKKRCAVCYQATGYDVPPVYQIDLMPTGLCELRRLIEPSRLHHLLCDPTYFANGPPASTEQVVI